MTAPPSFKQTLVLSLALVGIFHGGTIKQNKTYDTINGHGIEPAKFLGHLVTSKMVDTPIFQFYFTAQILYMENIMPQTNKQTHKQTKTR